MLPAADLGNESPMPDIKNVSYIHAGFKTTNRVSRGEKKHLGKGMIQTILPYKMQNGYNRVKKPREFNAISVENNHIRAVFCRSLGADFGRFTIKIISMSFCMLTRCFNRGTLGCETRGFPAGLSLMLVLKGTTR